MGGRRKEKDNISQTPISPPKRASVGRRRTGTISSATASSSRASTSAAAAAASSSSHAAAGAAAPTTSTSASSPSAQLIRENISCNSCDRMFNTHDKLQRHIRYQHSTDNVFSCNLCVKYFVRKSRLQDHIEVVHEGKRPYECKICAKKFSCKQNLQKHLRTNVHKQRMEGSPIALNATRTATPHHNQASSSSSQSSSPAEPNEAAAQHKKHDFISTRRGQKRTASQAASNLTIPPTTAKSFRSQNEQVATMQHIKEEQGSPITSASLHLATSEYIRPDQHHPVDVQSHMQTHMQLSSSSSSHQLSDLQQQQALIKLPLNVLPGISTLHQHNSLRPSSPAVSNANAAPSCSSPLSPILKREPQSITNTQVMYIPTNCNASSLTSSSSFSKHQHGMQQHHDIFDTQQQRQQQQQQQQQHASEHHHQPIAIGIGLPQMGTSIGSYQHRPTFTLSVTSRNSGGADHATDMHLIDGRTNDESTARGEGDMRAQQALAHLGHVHNHEPMDYESARTISAIGMNSETLANELGFGTDDILAVVRRMGLSSHDDGGEARGQEEE